MICALVLVVLFIGLQGYKSKHADIQNSQTAKVATKSIVLEPTLIEKTQLREQRDQVGRQSEEIKNLKEEIKNIEKQLEDAPPSAKAPTDAQPNNTAPAPIPSAEQIVQQQRSKQATPQNTFVPPPHPPQYQNGNSTPQDPEEVSIGGIGVVSNSGASKASKEKEEESKKKATRTIYLPPSFMEAELLTGFDAATSGNANNSPEPVLLRIQTPAQLPNDIKANLKGCFVIAEAIGRLDKERADVRITNLSCLDKKGSSIIDSKVKGFVTDADGKVGLSGHIVARMGASIARSFIAGVFGGAGQALQSSSTTQTVSPLGGTTSIVDPSQIEKQALGGGLSSGATALQKFYLDLAKQATPVCEVAPTKAITVVISEGVEVPIKTIPKSQNQF